MQLTFYTDHRILSTQSRKTSRSDYRRLPFFLALSAVWVSAEAATLFTVLDAFGSFNSLLALLATDFDVFSFLAISHPRFEGIPRR